MIHIGIDPGVRTGYAEWDSEIEEFICIATKSIIEAMDMVYNTHIMQDVKVHFEDATLRKWKGHGGRERLKGVGSVERDCKIWREFCEFYDIAYEAVAPQRMQGYTKLSPEKFKALTGYTGRTSEHARDASMLVWGK